MPGDDAYTQKLSWIYLGHLHVLQYQFCDALCTCNYATSPNLGLLQLGSLGVFLFVVLINRFGLLQLGSLGVFLFVVLIVSLSQFS